MLAPPPGGDAVETGGGGGGAAEEEAFSRLLRQLHEQHRRELDELRGTIEGLRRAAAIRGPTQVTKAGGDWIAAESTGDIRDGFPKSQLPNGAPRNEQPWSQGSMATTNQGAVAAAEESCEGSGQSNDVTVVGEDEDDHNHLGLASTSTPIAARVPTHSTSGKKLETGSHSTSGKTNHFHSNLEEVLGRSERARQNLVESVVDSVIGVCILVNIAVMFCRFEYEGYVIAVEVGLRPEGAWPDLHLFFEVMQHVFCAIFLIELVCRLAVHRTEFFYSDHIHKFNVFDAAVVAVTCIDLYIVSPFVDARTDLTVMRAARFARLLRAMRVIRTFEIFSKLRVLFSTVAASFYALLWSMVLLFVTMLMAAMLVTQLVKPYLKGNNFDEDMMDWLFQHYGTASRSLWTMFEATFSGGWPAYARPLVEKVSAGFAFFFAAYVSSVVFAMTRIITALFLKDTLEVASNDAEMVIHEKMREKKALAAKLLDVFSVADVSGDGKLSWVEFNAFFTDPKIKSYMATLELDAQESESLFHMLDDGDGLVTAEEFVQGAVRLKGTARSQDVVQMMHDCNKLVKVLGSVTKSLEQLHEKADTRRL